MSAATKILMGSGGEVLPSDDEFNNVSFLSHFDGANNGVNNVFEDSSSSNHTITAVGEATQGTFSPFSRVDGEWSNYFDGAGDIMTLASSADFGMGTGDFTWEAWVNQTYRHGSTWSQLFSTDNYDSGINVSVWITSAGNVAVYGLGPSNGNFTTSSTFPVNTWTHIAVVRKGTGTGEFAIYIDGVAGVTGAVNDDFPTDGLTIARHGSSDNNYYTGYISNFRIVKGTAVYTGNFTPATSALTAISGTVLLTCQSNRFKDNSASDHEITVAGTPKASAFTPILTSEVYAAGTNGASAYFDGSGDYLTVATSSNFDFGGGDFTLSAWLYSTNNNSFLVFGDLHSSGSTASWGMWWNHSAGEFRLGTHNLANMAGWAVTLNLNSWNHVVITRASSVIKFFFNGVEITSRATDSGNIDAASFNAPTPVYIGSFTNTFGRLTGYITDVSIIKGTAVNPSEPPTAPLTAITNTKLLLNMTNGQAIDSAAQNTMTLLGNADTSTTQQKFGTASLAVDGTGDYVTIPTGSFAPFGTGDFTIEGWVYFSTDVTGDGIFQLSSGYLNSAVRGPALGVDGSTDMWRWYYGTTGASHGSVGPSVDTWYHFAWVRNSGTSKVYIDGTEILSASDSTDYTDTYFVIGGYYSTSYLLSGYIDELRISKIARYTSNFTPSTEAFLGKGQ
jgi:hypothetical protein